MRSVIFLTTPAEIRGIDQKTRTIWHIITRETPDRIGDVIELAGISTKNFNRKPSVLYGHDYAGKDPVPVIAECVGLRREGKELIAGTRFLDPNAVSPKLRDLVNDLWYLNTKKLMGWSVGFLPNMDKVEKITDADGKVTGRRFKETELLEYSNVIIPCHQDAVNDAMAKGILHAESFGPAFIGGVPVACGEGRVFYCREVPESDVAGEKVSAAVEALRYCGRQLKLKGTIEICWFALADPTEVGARILGPKPTKAFIVLGDVPKVYLRVDLFPAELEFCAAHELHHAWFEKQPGHDNAEKETLREPAADAYAFIAMQSLRKKREEDEGIAEVAAVHAASGGWK